MAKWISILYTVNNPDIFHEREGKYNNHKENIWSTGIKKSAYKIYKYMKILHRFEPMPNDFRAATFRTSIDG